jgi:hypothetical protein
LLSDSVNKSAIVRVSTTGLANINSSNKKKPPPVHEEIEIQQLNNHPTMTAPKFFDEEREEEEDVLENEPQMATAQQHQPQSALVVVPGNVGGARSNNFVNPVAAVAATSGTQQDEDDNDDPATIPRVSVVPSQHDNHPYIQALKRKGLEVVEQDGDGNCLFRAVSLQVYGDASMHGEVRARCMDFMAVNEEHFGEFVTGETFVQYVARKRQDGVHGNNPEIQAISELYNRPVEVYTPDRGNTPLNIFHREYSTADIPIRLSYHDGNHYNAIIDPIRPTAGLGLGLPGLQPGLADKQQVATAVMESDQQMDLEKAIKESQAELNDAFDDDLQRALKESSESVAYVSFPVLLVFGLVTDEIIIHVILCFFLRRCTNKKHWLYRTKMPQHWQWNNQRLKRHYKTTYKRSSVVRNVHHRKTTLLDVVSEVRHQRYLPLLPRWLLLPQLQRNPRLQALPIIKRSNSQTSILQ